MRPTLLTRLLFSLCVERVSEPEISKLCLNRLNEIKTNVEISDAYTSPVEPTIFITHVVIRIYSYYDEYACCTMSRPNYIERFFVYITTESSCIRQAYTSALLMLDDLMHFITKLEHVTRLHHNILV